MKYISITGGNNVNKNTTKLDYDQYYTSYDDMEYCVNKALDVIKNLGYNVSEFLEPSAGEGIFSNHLLARGLNVIAMDLFPKGENIIQQDYLTCKLEYKPERFIIGNPPYGARLNLAQKFFKKSIELGDYIAFILPISQLWNSQSMYEFDLIYSEDLGKLIFSNNKKVHCCLNVYIRPKNGLNKKPSNKLKDVSIIRQDKKGYENIDCDIRIVYWGSSAGKILNENEHYAGEYKIIINNQQLKNDIIKVFNNVNWMEEINYFCSPKIQQFHIIKVLKKYIPNIK